MKLNLKGIYMNYNYRKDFDYLNNSEIVYLDNASTTLKPNLKNEDINQDLIKYNNKNHIGFKKNVFVEETRKKVAKFINCDVEEVCMTNSATESINTVAYSFCLNNLENEDEILISYEDHKSTTLPFLNIVNILKNFAKEIKIKEIKVNDDGYYNIESVLNNVTPKTKLVVLTHIHNVYGLKLNTEYLIENIKKINKDCVVLLDASQSIGHIDVDVEKLKPDLLVFSAHKMMAQAGVGILYIKKELINKFKPFIVGGNYLSEDLNELSSIRDLECGTKNYFAINSLGKAIDYIDEKGLDNITKTIFDLTRYLYENLKTIEEIIFNKGIDKCKCNLGYGILSFRINNMNSSEVGEVLRDYNIFIRTGDFCNTSNRDDFLRVSLYIYNTKEDIDRLIKVLKYIIKA